MLTTGTYLQFDPHLVSGSYFGMGIYESPSVTIIPEKRRAYAYCTHCGKKFLFQEKHINVPLFDLTCSCGAPLEIREE